jgi:hypothetical protein
MRSLILGAIVPWLILIPALTMGSAYAVNIFPGCQPGGSLAEQGATVCKDVTSSDTNSDPIYKIIKAAIEVISFVTGVAAVILILISGIRFMTSGGEPSKVSEAKSTLLYAAIGIFIVIVSQGIIALVLNRLASS